MKIALFLVCSVILVRLLPMLGSSENQTLIANFSPLVALMICGGAYFARKMTVLPLAGFFASDLILNAFWHVKMTGSSEGILGAMFASHTWIALSVFLMLVVLGLSLARLSGFKRIGALFAGSVLGSLLFYLASNTGAFFVISGYEKSLAGWIQCMTVGLPGFVPTWTFLVKSLAANVVFTGLFVVLFDWQRAKASDSEALAADPA